MPNVNGHEYVDLGLPSGTLWATMNVGANAPEEYGDYFAWGEIASKDEYSAMTYYRHGTRKSCLNMINSLKKYNYDSKYGKKSLDLKHKLELIDDVANTQWGGDWRMPTIADFEELKEYCTWTSGTQNGTFGYTIMSLINCNQIFIPAAGFREGRIIKHQGIGAYLWTSELYQNDSCNAFEFVKNSDEFGIFFNQRISGLSIRPVCS